MFRVPGQVPSASSARVDEDARLLEDVASDPSRLPERSRAPEHRSDCSPTGTCRWSSRPPPRLPARPQGRRGSASPASRYRRARHEAEATRRGVGSWVRREVQDVAAGVPGRLGHEGVGGAGLHAGPDLIERAGGVPQETEANDREELVRPVGRLGVRRRTRQRVLKDAAEIRGDQQTAVVRPDVDAVRYRVRRPVRHIRESQLPEENRRRDRCSLVPEDVQDTRRRVAIDQRRFSRSKRPPSEPPPPPEKSLSRTSTSKSPALMPAFV